LVKALAEPELRARMTGPLGIDVIGSTPEEFGAFLQAQMALWGRVVRENNIRSD
jgi:tripartite-type tricarboxylate transporter receptor subunit TctC